MKTLIGLSLTGLLMVLSMVLSAVQAQLPWPGRQFSVELVVHEPGMPPQTGMLYVGEGAMRMEVVEEGEEIVFLLEFRDEALIVRIVMPAERMYMETQMSAAELFEAEDFNPFTAAIAPDHPSHPCRTHPERFECRRAGTEEVNGVMAERWEISVTDEFGDLWDQTLWFDRERGVVVHLADEDGAVVAFHNYRFGPQPAELFEVPEDYQRFEVPFMMPGN